MKHTKVVFAQDSEKVRKIQKQIKENDGYCPCRLRKTEATKCVCKEFREAIAQEIIGQCHCGLYEIIDSQDK